MSLHYLLSTPAAQITSRCAQVHASKSSHCRLSPSLSTGSRTSFRHVTGVTLGDAITRNRSALPAEFQSAPFCDKYDARAEAAARTWQRPHAQDNLM